MKEVYVVVVPNTDYIRVYTTDRKALAYVETLRRDGMEGHVYKLPVNPSEEE
jgi:hypothetical protein